MKRSLHDKVLLFITYVAVILFVFSACLLDSDNYILFFLVDTVCIGWIFLFGYANRKMIERFYK